VHILKTINNITSTPFSHQLNII